MSCDWPSVMSTLTVKLVPLGAYQASAMRGRGVGVGVGRGVLDGAGVGGARGPALGRLARGGDDGVGRVAGVPGGVADGVVALRAVGADPVPLGRRVRLEVRRRRGGRADVGSKKMPVSTGLGPAVLVKVISRCR